jgi:DNA-binding NarL/FixJ family response regulator
MTILRIDGETAVSAVVSRSKFAETPIDEGGELTHREKQCLNLLAQGLTDKEISEYLGIVRSTVTFHSRNAVSKLRASNRCSAVYTACRRGII